MNFEMMHDVMNDFITQKSGSVSKVTKEYSILHWPHALLNRAKCSNNKKTRSSKVAYKRNQKNCEVAKESKARNTKYPQNTILTVGIDRSNCEFIL